MLQFLKYFLWQLNFAIYLTYKLKLGYKTAQNIFFLIYRKASISSTAHA